MCAVYVARYGDQWWIGATVHGPHNDHQWGNWLWDHNGQEIAWWVRGADWGRVRQIDS